jgi:hypothetical protein
MKKIFQVVGFILGVNVLAQDAVEERHNAGNVGAMKDLNQYAMDSVRYFCEDLAAKKCYAVLVVPAISGGADDPFSDGKKYLAGNKIARVLQQDIPAFYKALQDDPKHLVDVKPGDQYELVFLMKEHPTSDDYRISMRIYDGRLILRIRSKGGNGLFVEAGPAFLKLMDGQFVTFAK